MGVRCVFFGDSITAGQYVEERFHWTTALRAALGSSVEVSVGAVSGETTRQALERFPEQVQERAPDVLLFQFGLNDCNCWATDRGLPRVSEAAYEANLIEMVERAREFGVAETLISTNHPTLRRGPMVSGEEYESARRRYNDIVRRVADTTGVTLNDVEPGFPADETTLATLLLPEPDLLHLSPAGHRLYAEITFPTVHAAAARVEQERLTA